MKKIKYLIFAALILATVFALASCSEGEDDYQKLNGEGYTVTVKYDANGGEFDTGVYTVTDSYKEGISDITLLDPSSVYKTFKKEDHSFAGWYTECEKTVDANGNEVFKYSGRWNFDEKLQLDPSKQYDAAEPVLTLYAGWVPRVTLEYYRLGESEPFETENISPMGNGIAVPAWDEKKGSMDTNDFPELQGYTFNGAYLDAEGKNRIETPYLSFEDNVDLESCTVKETVLKVYVDYKEGEWFRITTAEQLKDNADINGNYEIMADLDFADERWPFVTDNFKGSIYGNGHTISNVTFVNDSKKNCGLFGSIADGAVIKDITFSNVTFTVEKAILQTVSYGMIAGSIGSEAVIEGFKLTDGKLLIDSKAQRQVEDYTISLTSYGKLPEGVEVGEVSCSATGDDPEKVKITVDGNDVTYTIEL